MCIGWIVGVFYYSHCAFIMILFYIDFKLKYVILLHDETFIQAIHRLANYGIETIGIYTEDDLNLNSFAYADKIFKVENLNDKSGFCSAINAI